MNMYDLIVKKKRGEALTEEEIGAMISGYTKGEIPDYQMAAMLMAVCFRGMGKKETTALTLAMARSGDMLDLSSIPGRKVDKHSTGGVGDKTSLVLAPLVASMGVPVAKMSGRGLGHTGGTIDKLESIGGFSTELSEEAFLRQVREIGIAIAGQTKDLAPADKKLYALRDVTGTVDELSLIASSIMSKKLASGADAIVLDVKTGDGAFMKTLEEAAALAEEMTEIGRMAGRQMTAVISNMDQPLGYAVGNALEVKEAVETLRGGGPKDLRELVLTLGSYMVYAGRQINEAEKEKGKEKQKAADDIRKELENALRDGRAYKTFLAFIRAQGGDIRQIEDTSLLPAAKYKAEVKAAKEGYVSAVKTEEIGRISLLLGGGRRTKADVIDPAVGVLLQKKQGDFVKMEEPLAVIYANDEEKIKEAAERLTGAYEISIDFVPKPPVVYKVL